LRFAPDEDATVDAWQWILLAFLFLLPVVLMVDYWGDERLTFRGHPVSRKWRRQIDPPRADDHH
jgi:hypothetical protein